MWYFLFLVLVINFAKKTGDYGSLSAVDLKVMALTHQLTCEHEPERKDEFRMQPSRDVRNTSVQ